MKLNEICCSLELSKKLKELGCPYKTLFFYFYLPHKDKYEIMPSFNNIGIPAYTTDELGRMLPKLLSIDEFYKDMYLTIQTGKGFYNRWYVYYEANYFTQLEEICMAEKLCDSLAKMLIYLIEKGFVKVHDLKL